MVWWEKETWEGDKRGCGLRLQGQRGVYWGGGQGQ